MGFSLLVVVLHLFAGHHVAARGLTIKDGMQGGGGQLSGALAMIIGGAIVVGAAVYFKTGINWGSLAG